MRCLISLAVIGSAFTVLSSLPAAATIPLSGDLNAIAETNINHVIVSDPESDSWTGVPASLATSDFATQMNLADIITASGNATATWSSPDSGTVNFNDYGWNFSVNNPAITFSEVSLDPLALGHDWSYRFTATSDGEITLTFDISLVSGSGLGLLGWQVSFTGAGGAGGPIFDAFDPTQRGVFTAPLVAGTTYRISLDGEANLFSGSALGDGSGFMNGSFNWNITSGAGAIPEPSAWTMLVVGFVGLGLVGRRRTTRTLAARV
jgi:hypothetical protein